MIKCTSVLSEISALLPSFDFWFCRAESWVSRTVAAAILGTVTKVGPVEMQSSISVEQKEKLGAEVDVKGFWGSELKE